MSGESSADDLKQGVQAKQGLSALSLAALGIVFADIGTSPLYAFRVALGETAADGVVAGEIFGVLSLALWALILIVTCKYVLFLMRANNDGEGGVLALMALAQRSTRRHSMWVLILGSAGAALFYGDGMVMPALSVMSSVEGLRTVPGLHRYLANPEIVLISIAIMAGLFVMQMRGTARIAQLFGPICLVWFLVIGALGLMHIADEPSILTAILPGNALIFLLNHGEQGLFVLGAVFLTVTGAEALTASMGHFGPKPVRLGWFCLVFPALILNYFGQGAIALHQLEQAAIDGTPFVNRNWFFIMAPGPARLPLVILAILATLIASQTVITGAFSLTRQAIQLGLLPRLKIRQTMEKVGSQVYLPSINMLLFIGAIVMILGFGSSTAMATAYGIAVSGTMVVTTCLALVILRRTWNWSLPLCAVFIAPFLLLDLFFFGANAVRILDGGWVPILIACVTGLVIATWVRGRALLSAIDLSRAISLDELAPILSARPPERVPGTAVFLTAESGGAPSALLHNLKHNKVLHERNFALTVRTAETPLVDPRDRLVVTRLDDNFSRAVLSYGFMESPNIPLDLAASKPATSGRIEPMQISYFIGRSTLRPSKNSGMPFWQDVLFIFLYRNASNPTDFFRIPPNRVVELGSQTTI